MLPTETIMALKQKRTVLNQLKKQLGANRNLMESLSVLPKVDSSCKNSLKKIISALEKQIQALENEMKSVSESEFNTLLKRLTSIKGIGVTVATALIIATGGFTYFDNAKQFSRYIGVCPTICQSGSSVNIRGGINRNGDETIRSLFYIASWSALRHNTSCREMYLRLRNNGKPGKVALVAVANKLIRQCFAVVRSDTPYIDGFVSTKPAPSERSVNSEA